MQVSLGTEVISMQDDVIPLAPKVISIQDVGAGSNEYADVTYDGPGVSYLYCLV